MTFGPFHEYFPIQASKDICSKTLISQSPNDPPSGEYVFVEMFCDTPDCDCRNAIISVQKKINDKFEEVARLRFCWEDNDFYDSIYMPFTNQDLPGVIRDINRKASKYDEYFIRLFENMCFERTNNGSKLQISSYAKTIKQHYDLYKGYVSSKTSITTPMQKVSRNSPCPCGSGRKYKHCCLMKKENVSTGPLPIDLDKEWICIRTCEDEVMEILNSFVKEKFGPEVHSVAKDTFMLEGKISPDMNVYKSLYNYWFCFSWVIENGLTVAQLCLHQHPERFTPYQKRLIEATVDTCFTFYLAQNVILDRRLILKDIFTQNIVEVKECSGTRVIKNGSIVFGRHVTLDNQSIMIGFAPYEINNRYFSDIVEARDRFCKQLSIEAFTPELLKSYDFELRKLFFNIMEDAFKPMQFSNSDGEPIVLQDILYELKCSTQEAFDKLFVLCTGENREKWLSDKEAKYDDNGELINISFPWLSSNSNLSVSSRTSLGQLTITRSELKIFVNSERRSAAIKHEVEKLLGAKAIYKNCKIIDINDKSLKNLKEKVSYEKANKVQMSKESNPKLSDQLLNCFKDYHDNHWKKWLDTSLPALANMTPRQAAKTVKGRELLEALFLDFESKNKMVDIRKNPYNVVDIDYLKRELGLQNSSIS